MLVKLHAIMWLQGMFSKLGFPIPTTYCGANFVPWWLGSFWYFLIDLIPGSSLALDCYAMYVWHFFSLIFYWDRTSRENICTCLGMLHAYMWIYTQGFHFKYLDVEISPPSLPSHLLGNSNPIMLTQMESKNLTLLEHSKKKKKSCFIILPLKYQYK